MADITYQPQFQAPTWKDNVDPILAEGPSGFNIQFQNLRAELDKLSGIIKQLSDQINSVNQTANTATTTANTAQTAANAATTAANTAQTAANKANSAIQAIMWGHISYGGGIWSGSGNFTVTKSGTGLYDIFFKPPFPSIPAIQAIVLYPGGDGAHPGGDVTNPGGDDMRDNAVVVGINASQCRIKTGAGGTGQATDLNFCFIAYCPPA